MPHRTCRECGAEFEKGEPRPNVFCPSCREKLFWPAARLQTCDGCHAKFRDRYRKREGKWLCSECVFELDED